MEVLTNLAEAHCQKCHDPIRTAAGIYIGLVTATGIQAGVKHINAEDTICMMTPPPHTHRERERERERERLHVIVEKFLILDSILC